MALTDSVTNQTDIGNMEAEGMRLTYRGSPRIMRPSGRNNEGRDEKQQGLVTANYKERCFSV